MPIAEPKHPSEITLESGRTASARALALRGDIAMALTQSRSDIRSHPKNARTLWDYGTILIDAGILAGVGFLPEQIGAPPPGARRLAMGRGPDRGRRMIEAGLRALHEALELGAPSGVRADAGRALLALGRRDDARTLMADAVARAPADAEAHALLATVLDRLGDYELATEHHALAQTIWAAADPDGPPLNTDDLDRLASLADALIDAGEPESAEALIGDAADRSDAHAALLRVRVRGALERGAPGTARPLLIHAALLNDEPQTLRPLLARLAGSGVAPEGEMAALDAWVSNPADLEALLALSHRLADNREASLAAVALRRLLEHDETRADAWQVLASVLVRTEGEQAAREAAERALAIAPDDVDIRLTHARLLESFGDREGSLGALKDATHLGAETGSLSLALAESAVENGDLEEALRILRRLLVDKPDNIVALRRFVQTLRAAGRSADAVVWARRLVAADESTPDDRHVLGACLRDRGRWDEARTRLPRPSPPASIQAGIWGGKAVGRRRLCLYHRGSDTREQSLLGVAVAASHLASIAGAVTAVIPASLSAVANAVAPRLEFLVHGDRKTRRALQAGRFTAAYPVSETMIVSTQCRGPIDGWLDTPERPRATDIYVLRAKSSSTPWPGLRALNEALNPPAGSAVRVVNAPAPDRAVGVLSKARTVITDDAETALLAIGLSCPVILIETDALGWWWGADGDRCPWSEHLTIVRRSRYEDEDTLLTIVRDAFHRDAAPAHLGARPTGSLDDGPVEDALDRFHDSLGATETGRPWACELLEGGTRNHVVKVDGPRGAMVLRPGRFPPPRVGFFDKEIGNMIRAAEAGIAPRVHASDPIDGAFVIDFVDGEVMRSATLRQPDNVVAAAMTYRHLHRLQGFTGEYDIFEKLAREVDRLLNADEGAMADYEESLALVHRATERLIDNAVPRTATHNDPLTRNFIRTDDTMLLIDWECSAFADPHWEVAAMAAQAGVRDDARRRYLETYFGRPDHPAACRVHLFEAVCHFYWWVDARTDALSGDPEEAKKDADAWWRRFRRTVDDPSFAQSMTAAKRYRYAPSDDA